MEIAKEILINGYIIPVKQSFTTNQKFEFIINDKLKLLQCIQLFNATPTSEQKINVIENNKEIHNILFELCHIRVNPKLNNNYMLSTIIQALSEIGIKIENIPDINSITTLFQPLGDLKEQVKFYIKENNDMIFLANLDLPNLTYLK